MKRRMFTIFSALSMLLSLAVVGLWVRSEFVTDYFHHTTLSNGSQQGTSYQFASGDGGLCISKSTTSGAMVPIHVHVFGRHSALTSGRMEGTLGSNRGYTFATYHFVPYKLLAALLLFLPLIRISVNVALRFQRKPGHCAHCDYDLRATPGRCPECGRAPASESLSLMS